MELTPEALADLREAHQCDGDPEAMDAECTCGEYWEECPIPALLDLIATLQEAR